MSLTVRRMRYHIRAWGSDRYPDLNYQSDELPSWLFWHYACANIIRLDTVSPVVIAKEPIHGQEAPPHPGRAASSQAADAQAEARADAGPA